MPNYTITIDDTQRAAVKAIIDAASIQGKDARLVVSLQDVLDNAEPDE